MTQYAAMELTVDAMESTMEACTVNITVAAVFGLAAEVTKRILLRLAVDVTE